MANFQSSDVSAAKPAFTQPKLSDVTRLLYSTVLEPTCGDEVKSSISHLVREIVTFSKKPSVVPPSKPSATLSAAVLDMIEEPKQEKEKHVRKEKEGDLRKVGAAKGEEVTKIAARSEARPVAAARAPEWKCPRCLLVMFPTLSFNCCF